MFSQTWKKYLPVITILIKRSVNGEQTLSMNHTDFERAAGGRKIKFSFSSLQLNNGRVDNNSKHTPLAKEFAVVLQEDEQVRKLLSKQLFEFSMSNDFQLHIKNNTPAAAPGADKPEEITEVTDAG
jgi:hypothetical protein